MKRNKITKKKDKIVKIEKSTFEQQKLRIEYVIT